jgi:uncharacterized membrane protein (DUF485 family)
VDKKTVNDDESRDIVDYKKRLGFLMFGIYASAYAVFVILSVYNVTLMDTLMPLGLNLSSFFGLGLIVLALILALVYSTACNIKERSAGNSAGQKG